MLASEPLRQELADEFRLPFAPGPSKSLLPLQKVLNQEELDESTTCRIEFDICHENEFHV